MSQNTLAAPEDGGLVDALLGHLEEELPDGWPATILANARLAIATVLLEERLSDDEHDLAAIGAPQDALCARRVERALATARACAQLPPTVDRVAVAGCGDDAPGTLQRSLPRTLALAPSAPADARSLLLTDEAGLEEAQAADCAVDAESAECPKGAHQYPATRALIVLPATAPLDPNGSESVTSGVMWAVRGGTAIASDVAAVGDRMARARASINADSTSGARVAMGVGTTLAGAYRLDEEIGKGGFGNVFKATHVLLDAPVAVKLLRDSVLERPEIRREFLKEAQRLTKLKHPHIVEWKNLGETKDGLPFLVMEFLSGEDLATRLERDDSLTPEVFGPILLDTLSALRAAHRQRDPDPLLHLDLKPQNVFLTEDSGVKVIDFGVSLQTHEGGVSRCTACTPEYASPEQLSHMSLGQTPRPVDGRSDLYSLGTLAYEALSGKRPFPPAKSRDQRHLHYLKMHSEVQPRPLIEVAPQTGKDLARWVDRCLEKDPDRRWESTDAAWEALRAIVQPVGKQRLAMLLGLLLILGIPAVWFLRPGGTAGRFPLTLTDGRGINSDGPVYTGDGKGELSLGAGGLDANFAREASWRLVATEGATTDTGWTVTPAFDGDRREIVLARPDRTPFSAAEVQIEAELGNERRASDPFTLSYLPAGGLRLPRLSLEGFEGEGQALKSTWVDPWGRKLRIDPGLPEENIGSILAFGSSPNAKRIPATPPSVPQSDWVVDLDRLGLENGTTTVTVIVVDRGGNEKQAEVSMKVALPLKLRAEIKGVARVYDERLLITPQSSAMLSLTGDLPDGRALDWEVQFTQSNSTAATLVSQQLHAESDVRELGEGWDLELSPIVALGDESSGTITVQASDTRHVNSLDPNRTVDLETASFRFRVSEKSPEPTLRINEIRLDDPSASPEPVYLAQRTATLSVAPAVEIGMEVRLSVEPEGMVEPSEVRFQSGRAGRLMPVALSFPRNGCYTLRVECWRLESRQLADKHEYAAEIPVVIDTAPESVSIQEIQPGVWTTEEAVSLPVRAELHAPDDSPTSPVLLSAILKRDGRSVHQTSEVVRLDEQDRAGAIVLVEPADTLAWDDGEYEVHVLGQDLSGRPVQALRPQPWSIARRGPEVAVPRSPRINGTEAWEPLTSNDQWSIQVYIADPNGVASASVEIEDRAGTLSSIECTLSPPPGTPEYPEDCRWSGAVMFPPDWSKKSVRLTFRATDRHDVPSPDIEFPGTSGAVQLGEILRKMPTSVRVSYAGTELTTMRRVKVDRGYDYTTRGRANDTELDRLSRFLPEGSPTPRDLRDPLAANFMGLNLPTCYYLDEHEVTVAQYLAFLMDDQGYLLDEHWADRKTPGEGARKSLLTILEEMMLDGKGDFPVTRVTWAEAWAYSQWCGKRLPTSWEWEYAARDGPEYLPWSGAKIDDPAPMRGYNVHNRDGGPHAANTGADITPDGRCVSAGIRNLCSNVSEWVATARECDGRSGELLRVQNDPSYNYCYVGASFRTPSTSYFMEGLQFPHPTAGREQHAVGFRCAIDGARLLDLVEDQMTAADSSAPLIDLARTSSPASQAGGN